MDATFWWYSLQLGQPWLSVLDTTTLKNDTRGHRGFGGATHRMTKAMRLVRAGQTSFSALGPAAIVPSCSGVQARVSFLRRQQSPGPVAPVRSGGRTLSPRPRLPARRSSASTALVERAGVPWQRLRHERSNPALAPRRSVLEPVRLRSMQRGGPYATTAVHSCTQGARSTPAQPGRASPSWTRPTRAGQDAADRRRASRSSATTSSWRTR